MKKKDQTIINNTNSMVTLAAILSAALSGCTHRAGYSTTTLPDNKRFSSGVQVGTRAEVNTHGSNWSGAPYGSYITMEASVQALFHDGTYFGYGLTPGVIFLYSTGLERSRDPEGRSLEFQFSPFYVMMKDGKVTLTPRTGINFDFGNVYVRAGVDSCYGDNKCKLGLYGGSGVKF